MFNAKTWLLTAVTILAGASALAQAPARSSAARAKAAAIPKVPSQRIEVAPAAPESTDPLAPSDALPHNVVKVLRTSDKAQTNSYVPIVFDFKRNNPFSVARFLRRPVQTEEGELFTFVDETGKSGKVLMVVPEAMIPSLRDLVSVIDRPDLTNSGGDYYSYNQLRHRRASATDPNFLNTAESFSTRNGQTFILDPEENALYLKDAPSGGTAFEAALKNWLDVPTAMLELVVKVYEIDAVNDQQLGLDYMAWRNGPGANLFAVGAFAEHGSFKRVQNVAVPELPRNNFTASGYNYAFRYDVPSAYFDFLTVKGKARLLNEAKLATLDSRPAELTAGDQVLYYAVATTDPSGVRDTGRPFEANRGRVVVGTTRRRDLTPVETGLEVRVTPVIGLETIKLNLELAWSDYSFVDDTGFPQINRRTLTSTLRGAIGEEILIGGLDRQVAVKSTRKAPLLGSIPILGYLFGGESSPSEKSRMVVAITPSAVLRYNLVRDPEGNLVHSTDPADRDYVVRPSEQRTIDQANSTTPILEPKAGWGFDQAGVDPEYGLTEPDLK